MTNQQPISVAFTVNDSYAQHCCVAMVSALVNNPSEYFDFYILTDHFSDKNKELFNQTLQRYGNSHTLRFVSVDDSMLHNLRLNITYISLHTYYRLLLAELLPEVDRILYIDADLVINGPIRQIWDTDMSNYICAGVRDHLVDPTDYKARIGIKKENIYFNAGVLLLNLSHMRIERTSEQLIKIATSRGTEFDYQDQDVLNIAFEGRIKELPFTYNYTDKEASEQIGINPIIIHYTGPTKPWTIQRRTRNPLAKCYFKYLQKTPYKKFRYIFLLKRMIRNSKKMLGFNIQKDQIKVALIVDEYFGACGTPYGGYGFLARHYIAKYIPCTEINIEVLFRPSESKFAWFAHKERVDKCMVITPPRRSMVKKWIKKQNYDIFLSIEITHNILKFDFQNKPTIHWIQDPRPKGDWEEIQTVKLFPEQSYWSPRNYDLINKRYKAGALTFISQAYCLNQKAIELYNLPADVPISYMPNPVEINYSFDPSTHTKKNHIIFIGRIESVKRGWLFCEIAKAMPQYEFFMLGQTFREQAENESIMGQYRTGINNLHFVGHVEGEQKATYIRDAKILVNTSIHEALPITFLEALAYGTLLVSCQNPDELTSKFGRYVGPVLGDGFDKLPLFIEAIERLITNEPLRQELSIEAVKYIRKVHPIYKFRDNMRQLIRDLASKNLSK